MCTCYASRSLHKGLFTLTILIIRNDTYNKNNVTQSALVFNKAYFHSSTDFTKMYCMAFFLQQIINVIIEEGAKFTELEYIHLLTLLHRSQPGITDEHFNSQKQKLKRTITEKHVYHV